MGSSLKKNVSASVEALAYFFNPFFPQLSLFFHTISIGGVSFSCIFLANLSSPSCAHFKVCVSQYLPDTF